MRSDHTGTKEGYSDTQGRIEDGDGSEATRQGAISAQYMGNVYATASWNDTANRSYNSHGWKKGGSRDRFACSYDGSSRGRWDHPRRESLLFAFDDSSSRYHAGRNRKLRSFDRTFRRTVKTNIWQSEVSAWVGWAVFILWWRGRIMHREG